MSSTFPASSSAGEPDPLSGASTPDAPRDQAGHDHAAHEHETNCDEAVAELYAFLDGELDDTVMIQVEAHLRRCSPCLEAFDFEADLRRVISAKCSEQVTPEVKARFCGMLHQLSSGAVIGVADEAQSGPGVTAPSDGS